MKRRRRERHPFDDSSVLMDWLTNLRTAYLLAPRGEDGQEIFENATQGEYDAHHSTAGLFAVERAPHRDACR